MQLIDLCKRRQLRGSHKPLLTVSRRGGALRASTGILLGWALLSVAFASGGTGSAEASEDVEEDQARLDIKGSSGTEFSGSCAIGDEEPEEISGQIPQSFTYDLDGNPLKCEITSEGNIEANLSVGNTHSVQR